MKKITYTCPMHPEVLEDKPGKCPHCGMHLVEKHKKTAKPAWYTEYMPLIVALGLILLTTDTLALRDMQAGSLSIVNVISYFMIGFFLVFGGFKLMDLKGFAEGYATYDHLAKKWPTYGYIYPFIEIFFALAMILQMSMIPLLWAEIIIMVFSGFGVALKLVKKEKFQCACLGTFLKVPLTKITLVENFGMAFLAALMLALIC